MPLSATKKGITTIKWGTGSTLGSPSAAIVESVRVSPKNKAPIEIEDSDGFAAILVFLKDGFDAEAVSVYDSALTWPSEGDAVTLTIRGTTYNCWVGSIEDSLARKKEATITLSLVYRPGVV